MEQSVPETRGESHLAAPPTGPLQPPSRQVIFGDAIDWLRKHPNCGLPGDVFTSIPDISELYRYGSRGREDVPGYKIWFEDAVKLIMSKSSRYCIFLQTDVRSLNASGQVIEFVDKSYLINKAAEEQGFVLVWQKICTHRKTPENDRVYLRPAWSNLICLCRRSSPVPEQRSDTVCGSPTMPVYSPYNAADFSTPDIFPRGGMVWARGIGIHAALTGVSFLLHIANATCICDPFCGQGTVLALANAVGVPSIGCELSRVRAGQAERLDMRRELLELGGKQRGHYGLKLELWYRENDLPSKPQYPPQKKGGPPKGPPNGKQAIGQFLVEPAGVTRQEVVAVGDSSCTCDDPMLCSCSCSCSSGCGGDSKDSAMNALSLS
jgi:hypothetical protein